VVFLASVAEHNQLLKVCFDGNKHLKHVMTSNEIHKMTLIEEKYPLSRLPVCGGCEKLAYWHHNHTAYCPSCGTITKVPITYASYLASGYDVDATGNTARMVLEKERSKRSLIIRNFGE
jgi:hypothetical protein